MKNSQLAAAQMVAMKMGQRLSGSRRIGQVSLGYTPSSRPAKAGPAAHFDPAVAGGKICLFRGQDTSSGFGVQSLEFRVLNSVFRLLSSIFQFLFSRPPALSINLFPSHH